MRYSKIYYREGWNYQWFTRNLPETSGPVSEGFCLWQSTRYEILFFNGGKTSFASILQMRVQTHFLKQNIFLVYLFPIISNKNVAWDLETYRNKLEKYFFPSISYYFHIPKIFDYLEFHCPKLEKIGIDEKAICYHNISN